MKKAALFLIAISILFSCSSDENNKISLNGQNYLVFGHFYGHCTGEVCIETFKLTDKSLFEDTVDNYNGENTRFIELEKNIYEKVKNLIDSFPIQLLNQKETVFGCPDCADGGGLFIQYSKNGNVKSWRIDQNKKNVPSYLHNFMDKINEKIALIK